MWGQPAIDIKNLPPTVAKATAMLPIKEGPFGKLVGVEHTVQGLRWGAQVLFWPVRRRQYFNPTRDHVCELCESVEGAHADWQEGKDWMETLPADVPRRDFAYREVHRVLEYAQTADGQWYAKKILVEHDFGEREVARRMVFIHVDVTREIPDELLDPDSITPDMFRAKKEQPAPE